MDSRSPLSPKDVVDEYFIENRTRLLEIAAFLDRLDRADPAYAAGDFRMQAFTDALAAIAAGTGRLERVQLLLSDPTTEPLGALDRKSAFGAYDRRTLGRRTAACQELYRRARSSGGIWEPFVIRSSVAKSFCTTHAIRCILKTKNSS